MTPIIDHTEKTILIVMLVCVVLAVLSQSVVVSSTFGVLALVLCMIDAIHHRRRTGRWGS